MTILNYDEAGYIIGTNRMSKGIEEVSDNTQEIVQILKSQNQISNTKMNELTRAVQSVTHRQRASDSVNRGRTNPLLSDPPAINDSGQARTELNRRAIRASNARRANNTRQSGPLSDTSTNSGRNRSTIIRDADTAGERTRQRRSNTNPNGGSNTRERDAKGRFTGSSQSASQSAFSRANGGIGNIAGGSLTGVDPLVDSLKEAKDLFSPLGRVAKAGGRVAKFSVSKLKAMKRREPLPIDQDRHNRENEKLLDKIWKAIRKSDTGGGGGLLGGLLGGGGGRGRGGRGRGLLGRARDLGGRGLRAVGGVKGLGAVGALAGVASLGMDWDGLNRSEKAGGVGSLAGGATGALVGGTIGSVVPVVGTAVGAVVGGYLGSKGGELLATSVEPHVSNWTNDLRTYNLAGKMETFWKDGMTPVFTTFADLGRSTKSWLSDMFSKGKSMFGFDGDSSGGGGGSGTPAGSALKAADYAIKNAANESLGKCAEFVNNAFQAQGLKASGNGVDVANNLMTQNKGKFENVSYDENYKPQVGDVMSMPSSKKSKHNYGHAAIYTDKGWVSDYKQGEKYGNTAAPNKDYYEDIQSGRIKPTIARMINNDAPKAAAGGDKAKTAQAMKYFTSQGWTKEQAAGITANLQQESQFNHKASGDSGKAYGIAQWHPDRQAKFKKKYGKDIKDSTYAEQLAYVNHELTQGQEKAAGDKLRRTKTAEQAAGVVSQYYERPKDVEGEKRKRAAIAKTINTNHTATTSQAAKAKPTSSTLGFGMTDIKGAGKTASSAAPRAGYGAANFAPTPMLTIPKTPALTQRLDSGNSDKPMVLQASNDTINQNVSDRDLAHAITGGLGQPRQWGA